MSVIEKYRIKRRLSRAELAHRIGVSTQTIWNYENKKRIPSFTICNNLAKVLAIKVTKILKDYINKEEK